jgi:hypothetical protein
MSHSRPSHHADLSVSILVQTAHISARRLSSSSCSTARIEIVRPRGHGQRIHRRHLWSLGPVSGERNVADGRRKPTVLSQRFRSAIRPIEASKAAVCYVRNTSIPAGRNAQLRSFPEAFANASCPAPCGPSQSVAVREESARCGPFDALTPAFARPELCRRRLPISPPRPWRRSCR